MRNPRGGGWQWLPVMGEELMCKSMVMVGQQEDKPVGGSEMKAGASKASGQGGKMDSGT